MRRASDLNGAEPMRRDVRILADLGTCGDPGDTQWNRGQKLDRRPGEVKGEAPRAPGELSCRAAMPRQIRIAKTPA